MLPRFLLLLAFALAPLLRAETSAAPAHHALARDLYRELIELNTTSQHGSTAAAIALRARLKSAGFTDGELILAGPTPAAQCLIVRLRGRGAQKPVLFLGHLDVVEALASDWSTDPFQLVEKDGYFYGRGATDMKDSIAAMVVSLIRMKQSGYVPRGDLIVAFTDHEEDGGDNGAIWLAQEHRDWIDAAYGINPDGGAGTLKNGRPTVLEFQTAEKTYVGIDLEVANPGGHGSIPVKDNAIYRLAAGLERLAAFDFPIRLNETTRAYFARSAAQESGRSRADMLAVGETGDLAAAARLAADSPIYNAMLRTTCVATQLSAGHAENALPQTARATLNARILPNETPEEVRAMLERVLADPQIRITRFKVYPGGPLSSIEPKLFARVEQLAQARWPGVTLVPTMSTGATDSTHFRNIGIPVYGLSGTFTPFGEVRAHGKDERLGVHEFYQAVDFMHDLMVELTK
jgi:acetylornithine deacetylase/succinyl-diaminopimelate desuccinylase-like protein